MDHLTQKSQTFFLVHPIFVLGYPGLIWLQSIENNSNKFFKFGRIVLGGLLFVTNKDNSIIK